MKILISNDDGVNAPGILTLTETLSEFADTVVVAPDRNRSGASSSLTLDNPLRVEEVAPDRYAVSGTPADCIHIAREVIFSDHLPDLVICGINMGANMGDDVIYSGTVAGAIEGAFLGVPSIAISLVNGRVEFLQTAAAVAKTVIQRKLFSSLAANQIMNINVPDLPRSKIKGFKVSRQGHRHRDNVVIETKDPKGNPVFWLGPPPAARQGIEGTDFYIIDNGYVSITPLCVDLTAYSAFESLTDQIGDLTL